MNGSRHWLPRHHVYYLTRPDFIKHDHIHRRKVEALRGAGLLASLISFVPQDMYEARRSEYQAGAADGLRRVVVVRPDAVVSDMVRRFFAWRLLFYRRVVVQVLLCDPEPLLQLKQRAFIGRRLRCIIEHEGDIASECLYRWTFDPNRCPPSEPPPEFKAMYDGIVVKEAKELERADGAVLVTPAHKALWERRMNRQLDALTLPTFFDPARFSFSAAERLRLRTELGLEKEIVLAYSGSVSMPWQRFESACQFVGRLRQDWNSVRLLALVHPDGHPQAQQIISSCGLKGAVLLLGVPPGDMARYLSAADAALFLRHNHLMNQIVTSAKLGEYLAAGLPVVTTWACPYYRPLVEKHAASLELPDTLELPSDFQTSFTALIQKGHDAAWRKDFSKSVLGEFLNENDLMKAYAEYIIRRLQ